MDDNSIRIDHDGDEKVISLDLTGEVDAKELRIALFNEICKSEGLDSVVSEQDILDLVDGLGSGDMRSYVEGEYYLLDDDSWHVAPLVEASLGYSIDIVNPFELSGDASGLFAGCNDIRGLDKVDVSGVSDMRYMFYNCSGDDFNPDISDWDVSNVELMSGMFADCRGAAFNPDVSNWDVSHVTDMNDMFDRCSGASFNPDVSEWNTSNVTEMFGMFYDCHGDTFDPDVSNWDVSSVESMAYMFGGCSGGSFNPDVSDWDTSNVKYMTSMFENCHGDTFDPDVIDWDTSEVQYMSSMFKGCSGENFNPDVSNWNVSNVTDMNYVFDGCSDEVSKLVPGSEHKSYAVMDALHSLDETVLREVKHSSLANDGYNEKSNLTIV